MALVAHYRLDGDSRDASGVRTLAFAGTPTGGGYALTTTAGATTSTTSTIAHDATAAAIQVALESLPNVGPGGATVSGSAAAGFLVSFVPGSAVALSVSPRDLTGATVATGTFDGTAIALTYAAGKQGQAGNFARPNSYVRAGAIGPSGATSFSVAQWVNFASFPANSILGLCGRDNGEAGGWFFFAFTPDSTMRFSLRRGESATEARQSLVPANLIGSWTHFAGVFDSATGLARIYLNGVSSPTATGPAATTGATSAFEIGSRQLRSIDRFHGLIDDVRLYDHALSQAEVAALLVDASVAATYGAQMRAGGLRA